MLVEVAWLLALLHGPESFPLRLRLVNVLSFLLAKEVFLCGLW